MRVLSAPATAGAPADADLDRRHVAAFLADASYEVTPGAADRIADLAAVLRPGTGVAITFLPGARWQESVRIAARLARDGMVPIPHVAARSLASAADLADFARALSEEAGATRALVIAGSPASPRGPFRCTMDVLCSGALQRRGFRWIGVAGHPEGSPDIPPAELDRAIADKNALASGSGLDLEIVTQFCFDPDAVIAWEERLRAAGNRLPVRVGLPGPATLKSLLAYGSACGVGASLGFLRRRAGSVARMMTVTAPDRLVAVLARHVAAHPATGIVGAHVFPFGGLARSAAWVEDARSGRIRFTGDGFAVGQA